MLKDAHRVILSTTRLQFMNCKTIFCLCATAFKIHIPMHKSWLKTEGGNVVYHPSSNNRDFPYIECCFNYLFIISWQIFMGQLADDNNLFEQFSFYCTFSSPSSQNTDYIRHYVCYSTSTIYLLPRRQTSHSLCNRYPTHTMVT